LSGGGDNYCPAATKWKGRKEKIEERKKERKEKKKKERSAS
jgi:hypothetical protein